MINSAIDKGTDMLELDVRLTKDGRVVVFHDADLSRMTGKNVKISDLEYSQLPILCPAVHIDTIPGIYYDERSSFFNLSLEIVENCIKLYIINNNVIVYRHKI